MQKLIESIRQPLIFFFPKVTLEQASGKTYDGLEKLELLDTLIFINQEGKSSPIKNVTEILTLLNKQKILKSNIYELLDLKSKIANEAFHYFLEDYFNELFTWITTTEIIKDEAKDLATNYSTDLQSYLNLQHEVLKKHLTELNANFGEWKSTFELKRVLKFDTLRSTKNEQIIVSHKDNAKTNETENVVDSAAEKKKRKPKIMSDADVDHYLLETIFQVDFSKIKE